MACLRLPARRGHGGVKGVRPRVDVSAFLKGSQDEGLIGCGAIYICACIYIYIYMCTYIYIYTHLCIYMYIGMHVQYVYIYIICVYTYTCAYYVVDVLVYIYIYRETQYVSVHVWRLF